MKKFMTLGIVFVTFAAFAVSAGGLTKLSRKVTRMLVDGAADDLSREDRLEIKSSLQDILAILEGDSNRPVRCLPEDSTDYAIYRKSDGKMIGEDIRGNSWCKLSVRTATANVVLAPEDTTDFAVYRISDAKMIGEDVRGNSWWSRNNVNRRAKIVCAPEDTTDFAIYRISDGQIIGEDKRGYGWCQQAVPSADGEAVCAPEDSTDFALFRISDGKQISNDFPNLEACLRSQEE